MKYRWSQPFLLVALGLFAIACANKDQPEEDPVAVEDTTGKSAIENSAQIQPYDSNTLTPYTCAARSLKAMEQGNIIALLPYIHPAKGLTISHVNEYIAGHEQPFSITEMQSAFEKKPLYTVYSGYEQELRRKTTLACLLQYYAGSNSSERDSTPSRFFSTAKDIRRNYTGNGTYTLQPPLSNKQTTISYHFSDSKNEMNWQELVLRTETYKGKDYLVEVLRAYWTP